MQSVNRYKHSIIQLKQVSAKLNNLKYSKGYTTHYTHPFHSKHYN